MTTWKPDGFYDQHVIGDKDDITIDVVNRKLRIVIDSQYNRGVITHFFDASGEECEPENAVSCVAECAGRHYAINLNEYEAFSSH